MAAQILTEPSDLEQVRKALDAALTDAELTDSTIELPFYLDVGEAIILRQVTDWKTLQEPDKTFFKAAAVAQVAALLAPAMPGILPKSEEGLTYKVTRDSVDWAKKAADLQQTANGLLGRISTQDAPATPASMIVTGPTRIRKAGASA